MWVVVHFVDDNAVEAVPETWYKNKNKTCAWPIISKNSKKHIVKQDYPDENNYMWYPARVLGRKYATLEEARSKTNVAQFQSELSANDEDLILQNKSKCIGSPPSLKPSKMKKTDTQLKKRVFDKIDHNDSDIDNSDDDPDYSQPLIIDGKMKKTDTQSKKRVFDEIDHYGSDIENFGNDSDSDYSQPLIQGIMKQADTQSKKRVFEKNEPNIMNNSDSDIILDEMKPNTLLSHKKTPTQLLSTFEVQTLDCEFTKVDDPAIVHHSVTKQKLILHSPISDVSGERKRIMIKSSLQNQQHQTPSTSMSEQNMSNNIKKVLFPLQNSDGSKGSATMSRIGTNKKYDFGMTDSAFKNFVVNSLTKLKNEIAAIHSTINSTHLAIDTFLNDSGQKTANQLASHFADSYSLDDVFPITNEKELEMLNNKICHDKQFKLATVSKLSLLVGNKDIGDSVRRLVSRMFTDDILTFYSLQGKKQKKNFSKLPAYQLIIDALRIHSKFKDKIDKEFNDPLANWINHSKFRIINKMKAAEKTT